MTELFRNAMYASGSFVFVGLLFVPLLFQLTISIVYVLADALFRFRERHGML